LNAVSENKELNQIRQQMKRGYLHGDINALKKGIDQAKALENGTLMQDEINCCSNQILMLE